MKKGLGNRFSSFTMFNRSTPKGFINVQKEIVQMMAIEQQNMGEILLLADFYKNKINERPCFLDYIVSFLLGLLL